MTAGEFIVGVGLLAATLGPLGLGAYRLRRRVLPKQTGPPARLSEIVLGSALLFAVEQGTGLAGSFRRSAVVAACAGVGLLVAFIARPRLEDMPDPSPPRPDAVQVVVAVLAGGLLIAQWTARVASSFATGIVDRDSLGYHLPIAARFVQTGRITFLHFLDPQSPNLFHPANSELLHALGMLIFGNDVLSPLLNLLWIGFILLAAWCVGRPWGVGPAAVVAVSILMATPIVSISAGSALNDVPSMFYLLAAVALLVQPEKNASIFAIAGAAAGLALGTKLTVAATAIALTVGFLIIPRFRRAAFIGWLPAFIVTGVFWYVRNAVRSGSPLPHLRIGVGRFSLPSPRYENIDRFGFSVMHYMGDLSVWRDWFLPGLYAAVSPAWWAIFVLAGAGMLIAVFNAPDTAVRLVGAAALVGIVVYLFMPTTALGSEGQPAFFALNIRYGFPAVLIGLALLPCVLDGSITKQRFATGAFAIVLAITETAGGDLPGFPGVVEAWPRQHRATGALIAIALLAAVGVVFAVRRKALPSWTLVASAAALAIGATALTYTAQRTYFDDRYAMRPEWAWADRLESARFAVTASQLQYPFYGRELTNFVQMVGRTGSHGTFRRSTSCVEWRRLLDQGRYDYVVVSETDPEAAWTRTDPAASESLRAGNTTVFRRAGSAGAAGCG